MLPRKFKLFASGPDTNLNACVGDNGSPGVHHYIDGYFVAADAVLEQIIAGPLHGEIDTTIYPVLFCARHAIELSLKAILSDLQHIAHWRPGVSVEDKVLMGHDLDHLWEVLATKAKSTDRRLCSLVDELSPLIRSYADIDPNGQVFRYPHDLERRYKHLKDRSLINVERFRAGLEVIKVNLGKVRYLVGEFPAEYSLGTFTKTLSRFDIDEISRKLPNRNEWSSNEFMLIKDEILNEYGISNREFSKALNLIQEHMEFCTNIGLEKPLQGVFADDILLLLNILGEPREPGTNVIWDIDLGRKEDWAIKIAAVSSVSDGTLRAIYAIFDFGADRYRLGPEGSRCEIFEEFSENFASMSRQELLYELKSNLHLKHYLATGLRDLGQTTLMDRCSLTDCE